MCNLKGDFRVRVKGYTIACLAWGPFRAPLGPLKGLGRGPFQEPPWALIRAWARALSRAPLGPLKGLGPGSFKSHPGPSLTAWAQALSKALLGHLTGLG